MPEHHVMIDLETLGTQPGCSILSIGACKFHPNAEDIGDTFYQTIDLGSCDAIGLKPDNSAVSWWLDPDRNDARRGLLDETIDIGSALEGFWLWYGNESVPTWSNGASFDLPIMEDAYRRIDRDCPWNYYHQRCYRTIKSLPNAPDMERRGSHHNALDDAVSQARHLQKIAAELELLF